MTSFSSPMDSAVSRRSRTEHSRRLASGGARSDRLQSAMSAVRGCPASGRLQFPSTGVFLTVATVLYKQLKRQVTVDGADYTVALDPDGIRLTGKGKRKPEVELHWRDLLSGEAALAVALNASLGNRRRSEER